MVSDHRGGALRLVVQRRGVADRRRREGGQRGGGAARPRRCRSCRWRRSGPWTSCPCCPPRLRPSACYYAPPNLMHDAHGASVTMLVSQRQGGGGCRLLGLILLVSLVSFRGWIKSDASTLKVIEIWMMLDWGEGLRNDYGVAMVPSS